MSAGERRYFVSEPGSREEPRVVAVAGRASAPAGSEEASRVVDPQESRGATIRVLPGSGRIMVTLAGRSVVGFAERRDGVWHVELEGRAYRFRVDDERTHELRSLTAEHGAGAAAAELRAPMPGLVVRVAVTAGDEVEAGDPLVVMEAMKMENELRAEAAGTVAEVHASEGTTVDRDEVLVIFELEST